MRAPKVVGPGQVPHLFSLYSQLALSLGPVPSFRRTDLLTEFLSRSHALPRAPVAGLQGDGCSENSPAGQLVPWPTLLRVTAKPPTVPQGVPVEGEDPTGPGGKAPAEECWPLGSSWRGRAALTRGLEGTVLGLCLVGVCCLVPQRADPEGTGWDCTPLSWRIGGS